MSDLHLPRQLTPGTAAVIAMIAAASLLAGGKVPAGTWRYKDRGVWIQLHADGRAYQCRVDKDGTTTYTSVGTVAGNKVKWEWIWGENEIELTGDTLILIASGRRLHFTRTAHPMYAICKSPLAPP